MSATDNAMARFLFAILQQKSLKDIDWNKVAHDPLLAQEISNGHAARMRYFRFRAAMLGLEPQRRNRTSSKSRVSKKKKEDKSKRGGGSVGTGNAGDSVKADSRDNSPHIPAHAAACPFEIKGEKIRIATSSQSSPVLQMMPYGTQSRLETRLLTPCSDSDLLASTPGFSPGPDSGTVHVDAPFDFASAIQCSHDPVSWDSGHSYASFNPNYEFESYADVLCSNTNELQRSEDLEFSGGMVEDSGDPVTVKHEDWDALSYQHDEPGAC